MYMCSSLYNFHIKQNKPHIFGLISIDQLHNHLNIRFPSIRNLLHIFDK